MDRADRVEGRSEKKREKNAFQSTNVRKCLFENLCADTQCSILWRERDKLKRRIKLRKKKKRKIREMGRWKKWLNQQWRQEKRAENLYDNVIFTHSVVQSENGKMCSKIIKICYFDQLTMHV